MAEYDIFISCKSEDYSQAEEIYKFLISHNKRVFLAPKELRKLGKSEYRKAIERALEKSTHLIVFASDPKFLMSEWVEYEWGLFVQGKLDGTRNGNLITILKDVRFEDIYFALRKYQSLSFDDYEETILDYTKGIDSLDDEEDSKNVSASDKPKRIKLPEWVIVVITLLGAFICFYIFCFSGGYIYNRFFTGTEDNMQLELLSHVKISGPVVIYDNNGIVAVYDAETQNVRSVEINEHEYSISGRDLFRAASITTGFVMWSRNLKFMKTKGKSGVALIVGSFVGTLFGYSTGKYVAEQNCRHQYQQELFKYLTVPEHWIICQQEYDERKRIE